MPFQEYTKNVLKTYHTGGRLYRETIAPLASASRSALHLGCGRDLSGMRRLFGETPDMVQGADPDLQALSLYPGRAWWCDGELLPFAEGSFDLIFSEMVLEHLKRPQEVFKEVARVLVPKGSFVSLTPNFWSYKSLAAWLTPHSFHEWAVRKLRRGSERNNSDVYPTFYRANSAVALRCLAADSGLTVDRIIFADNGPTWFQRLPGLFELGRLYHSVLRVPLFAGLRCNIVSVFSKPGENQAPLPAIRCVKCSFAPMREDVGALVCSNCDRVYSREGHIVKVL
jgi:SAM-dependent methyltransferase